LTVSLSEKRIVGQVLGGGAVVGVWRIALREQDDPPCRTGRRCHPETNQIKEGMDLSMVGSSRLVTGGVDTHLEVNVAAVLDRIGGLLGTASFPTTVEGNRQLLKWMAGFGRVVGVGVEGTGSYGWWAVRVVRRQGADTHVGATVSMGDKTPLADLVVLAAQHAVPIPSWGAKNTA